MIKENNKCFVCNCDDDKKIAEREFYTKSTGTRIICIGCGKNIYIKDK